MKFIKCKYIGKIQAITLAPFCVLIRPDKFNDLTVRRHEAIHWQQQRKGWYIGFYMKYLYEALTKGYRKH